MPGAMLFAASLASFASLAVAVEEHKYCIVGAGPAGLQLGHFLKHQNRDYLIFERNARPGSFFEHYPRHRRLISLNKRNVRENRSADFAFRHDWNTLIDVREEAQRPAPVTARSKELFPHASVLTDYLREFAAEQEQQIRYGSLVQKVRRAKSSQAFEVQVLQSGAAEDFLCGELILASGLARARAGENTVDGSELLLGYEDMPESGESFEGKAVVVLGQGNAALETVQELQKYTSEVHLLSRPRDLPQGGKGVRFAFETHYVGDIRAGRTTILDTYLLKSLDTFDFDALPAKHRLALVPCAGRLCVFDVEEGDCADQHCKRNFALGGQNLSYTVPIAAVPKDSEQHRQMEQLRARFPKEVKLEETEMHFWAEGNQKLTREEALKLGIDPETFRMTYVELLSSTAALRSSPELAKQLAELRASGSHDNLRFPMDHVIRCFGWTFDGSILDEELGLQLTHAGKYPRITPSWEVAGVPGMYAAGTISHSLDFRKSAGGFIHGFRYTARALFRLLEERNFGAPWPEVQWQLSMEGGTCSDSLEPVVDHLLARINAASGPYQMFEFLGDMLLFEANSSRLRFLEEVPLQHFHERYKDIARLTWVFRYHDHFHGPAVLGAQRVGATSAEEAHNSKFLHPHLAFFPAGASNATMRHWLLEDVFTQWNSPEDRALLLRFLARVTAVAAG